MRTARRCSPPATGSRCGSPTSSAPDGRLPRGVGRYLRLAAGRRRADRGRDRARRRYGRGAGPVRLVRPGRLSSFRGGGGRAAGRERVDERNRRRAPTSSSSRRPRNSTCANCGGTDDFLQMNDAGPLCLTCADLDTLVFLPAGDAALTRRARKVSTLSAVVVRWSRGGRGYERQGTLVEPVALELAEEQCFADEEVRARRRERDQQRRAAEDVRLQAAFAERILALFPGCPGEAGRRDRPARGHPPERTGRAKCRGPGGGRRGGDAGRGRLRAARGHSLRPAAHVRGISREEARALVRNAVDAVLDRWRAG